MLSAIVDFRFAESHLMVNSEYIKAIRCYSDVLIFDWGNYYDKLKSNNVNLIETKCLSTKTKSPLFSRFICLLNMVINRISIKKYNIDKIFVFGFDVIVFAFGSFLFKNKKVYLFHHMQIDELKSKTKRFFFNLYKNRVTHVVLAEYIKKYLVEELGVHEYLVFVANHPIYEYDVNITDLKKRNNNRLFVGLSNSNDEKIIEEIIKIETQEKMFHSKGCHVILKSKYQQYNDGNLIVFTGYLPRDVYDRYYRDATAVLTLIGNDFVYRLSGTVIDALSYGKIVIGMEIRCMKEYEKYRSLCKIAKNSRELIYLIIEGNLEIDIRDYENFKRENSFENLRRQIGIIFNP